MKVDRKRFIEALEYIKLVNSAPFDELDLSEFPENDSVTDKERKEFKFTGLINKDFIEMYLLSGGIEHIEFRRNEVSGRLEEVKCE